MLGYHSPTELWSSITPAEWQFWVQYDRDCQWGDERADARQEALLAYIGAALGGSNELPGLYGPNYFPTEEEKQEKFRQGVENCEAMAAKIRSGEFVVPKRRKNGQ